MRRTGKILTFALVAIAAAGCSDGPLPITHDSLAFWNEVCDNMALVTDEDSAKRIKELQFDKLLEEKSKALAARYDKRMRELDRIEKAELDDILLDYYYEIVATKKRIENSKKRLAAMQGGVANYAGAIITHVDAWQKMMENWGSQIGGPAADKGPVQFSKGVAPLRQSLTAAKK
jgi:hypothetical protein